MFWIENFKDVSGLWVLKEDSSEIPKIVLGVDPSWGLRDYSAIVGLEIKTAKQILEYRGRITMSELFEVLKMISLENSYFIVRSVLIEGNLGRDLIDRYEEWLKNSEEASRLRIILYKDKNGKDLVITSINRPILLAKVREAVITDFSIVKSPRLLEELNNLIIDRRGKEGAAPGFTDDLVFAFAMALKCREEYILRWASYDEIREEKTEFFNIRERYIFPTRGEGSYLDELKEEMEKLGLPTKSIEIQKIFEEINRYSGMKGNE